MIYLVHGNDTKSKKEFINKIASGKEVVRMASSSVSEAVLNEYAQSTSLFGESPVLLIDNAITETKFDPKVDVLKNLSESNAIFIFSEFGKLSATAAKSYKKYATIEVFELKESKKIPSFNTFAIADAFARKDKINSWILYLDAIERNIEPEAVCGIIFWKIKSMATGGNKYFNQAELKNMSTEIVSLYHKAHRGELDFTIGLEQFILSSLSK